MSKYEEFLTDRAFAGAFAAAYRGRHLPADALWWLENPGEASPNGVASPARSRAHLQAAAFSRSGDAGAHIALERLEEELAADRETTLAALAQVAASERMRQLADETDGYDEEPLAADAAPAADALGSLTPSATKRKWWPWVAASAVAVLLVGAGVAAGVAIGVKATEPPIVTPAHPATKGPHNAKFPMLDVFSNDQTPDDIPADFIPGTPLQASSFRKLGSSKDLNSGRGYAEYAVRDVAGSPCYVVILTQSGATGITCVPEASLTSAGIPVYVQDREYYADLTWTADGSSTGFTGTTVTELTP